MNFYDRYSNIARGPEELLILMILHCRITYEPILHLWLRTGA